MYLPSPNLSLSSPLLTPDTATDLNPVGLGLKERRGKESPPRAKSQRQGGIRQGRKDGGGINFSLVSK